ncbi:glycosyl transferase family 90-domain-containing protein [Mycena olivaceomarginata]|nr:glycosyl transferase family 90-domain-containing protein [Mycena olivaceomarginata]
MNYLRRIRNHFKPTLPQSDFESSLPLLPLQNFAHDDRQDEDKSTENSYPRHDRSQVSVCWGWGRSAAATAGILGAAACAIILTAHFASAPYPPHAVDPSIVAREAVDALYARQSTTLAQASGRYTLRTGHPPPPHYENLFTFAREKGCLIDEYDQIHHDFKPFYQLARANASSFQDMIDHLHGGQHRVLGVAGYLAACACIHLNSPFLPAFSSGLPNMAFLINGRDEPRVAFNYRAPGARENAFLVNDSTPFQIQPHPTSEFFAHQSGCNVPLESAGFMATANGDSVMLASAKPGYTTDLYPMLSMAKISPCFSDILFPTEYYYQRSWWSGKYGYPDNVPWHTKKPQICKFNCFLKCFLSRPDWRGMSNGGMINGTNYHHFARFKLVDIGRQRPDLLDVAITTFAETLCEEGCDRDSVIAEYNITREGQSREDLYKYKYAVDVDGTTFSGRFLGLLRSGSLVFKSTLFEEYFNDWLRPFEHYVPVLADLSDLVQKVEWANANPEEARLIQQRGLEVARRVLTDDQNDCYLYAALLEWAQLQDYARGSST